MIADLSLVLAVGGEQVSDSCQLRTAQGLFGPVASDPTFIRFVNQISKHLGSFDYAFATRHREVRVKLWAAVQMPFLLEFCASMQYPG